MADEIELIELKPGRAVVSKDLTGWYDGQWLEFRVVGNSGPTRIGFAPSKGGAKTDPEYTHYFDPADEATGLYSISPADLADVTEGSTIHFTAWEWIGGRPIVKAFGTVTKGAAIRVPDFGPAPGPEVTLGALTLSNASIPAGSSLGAVIGTVQGAQSTSTVTMPGTAGGQFAVAGRDVVVAGPLVTGSQSVTLRETMAEATNSPLDTPLSIAVGEAVAPTLAALTLSASTVSEDAAIGTLVGTVQGRTAGSTLSLAVDAGGLFSIDSSSGEIRTAAALDYETATSHDITIRETLAGATGSPRDTAVAIIVSDVADTAPPPADPTIADVTASVSRNATNNIVVAPTGTLDEAAYSWGFYAGTQTDPALVDPAFITLVALGATYTTGSTFTAETNVIAFITAAGDTSTVIDSGLIETLPAVATPTTTISQTTAPSLATPTEGDTALSAYTAGSTGTYTADNGQTISSIAAQMRVGGVDVADSRVLAAGESLTVRETVTASDGTTATFDSVAVTVEAAATEPGTTSPVSDQTATFGSLNTAGSAPYQITADDGEPITNAAATGGTATGYTLTSAGRITPSADGSADAGTITVSCDQGTATVTLSLDPAHPDTGVSEPCFLMRDVVIDTDAVDALAMLNPTMAIPVRYDHAALVKSVGRKGKDATGLIDARAEAEAGTTTGLYIDGTSGLVAINDTFGPEFTGFVVREQLQVNNGWSGRIHGNRYERLPGGPSMDPPIDVEYVAGAHVDVEDNDFLSPADETTYGNGIVRQRGGTDADGNAAYASVDIRRNYVMASSGDPLKLFGASKSRRQIVEHNYLGPGALLQGPWTGAYDSLRGYAAGEYINNPNTGMADDHGIYRALVDLAPGVAPPATGTGNDSDANWSWSDPHSDGIAPLASAGGILIRNNIENHGNALFPSQDVKPNNGLRVSRNTGTTVPLFGVTTIGNHFLRDRHPDSTAFPIALDSAVYEGDSSTTPNPTTLRSEANIAKRNWISPQGKRAAGDASNLAFYLYAGTVNTNCAFLDNRNAAAGSRVADGENRVVADHPIAVIDSGAADGKPFATFDRDVSITQTGLTVIGDTIIADTEITIAAGAISDGNGNTNAEAITLTLTGAVVGGEEPAPSGDYLSGTGTISATATDPTTITVAEQDLPVYDSDPYGTGLAAVPISGTHDGTEGAALQVRVFDADTGTALIDWTDIAAGAAGAWAATAYVSRGWTRCRAEVRVKAATTTTMATQTGRWFSGYIGDLHGQSLAARPITDTAVTATLAPPAESLWVLYNAVNQDGTLAAEEVTASSTLGLRRQAHVVAAYSDAPVMEVDGTHSGTGRPELADDSLIGRDYAASFADPVATVRSGGSDVSQILEHWFTNDAASRFEFTRLFLPWYANLQKGGLGDTDDGSGIADYTGGLITVRPGVEYTANHHMFDLSSDGTQGLFDPARTRFTALLNLMPTQGAETDGNIAVSTQQRHELADAVRQLVEDEAAFAPTNLPASTGEQRVFYGHLAAPGGTHVAANVDGESLVAVYLMMAMLRGWGVQPRVDPQFDFGSAVVASDGSYIDVTVTGLGGNPLSTAYLRHAAGDYAGSFEAQEWEAPTVLPGDTTELRPVHGFMLTPAGGTTSFSGFNAVIQDAAAGIVRFTKTAGAWAEGDALIWGDGIGLTDLTGARPHLHLPLAATPHVSGTGYGAPVRRGVAGATAFTVPASTEWGGTTEPEPTTGTWDVTGGSGSLTINAAPAKPATPVVTGGAGKITITE